MPSNVPKHVEPLREWLSGCYLNNQWDAASQTACVPGGSDAAEHESEKRIMHQLRVQELPNHDLELCDGRFFETTLMNADCYVIASTYRNRTTTVVTPSNRETRTGRWDDLQIMQIENRFNMTIGNPETEDSVENHVHFWSMMTALAVTLMHERRDDNLQMRLWLIRTVARIDERQIKEMLSELPTVPVAPEVESTAAADVDGYFRGIS